jgi:eukaryotic-like serine/threonine-protein kinase
MTCPRCGRLSPDSAISCPSCGTPLSRQDDAEMTRLPASAPAATEPAQPDADLAETSWRDHAPAGAPGGRPGPRTDEGPLRVGQAFGPRYHIIKLVGLGGMGAVYQAWDDELGVVVALKVIRPEVAADPMAARDLERRFKRELLLARQVTHTNVVRIHDLGEIDGVKYITMPFVEGGDLATMLDRDGKLPVARALRIARSALSGLVAAHAAGVVHRDLKPANLMVTEAGDALIMDFGIARAADEADASRPPVGAPRSGAPDPLGGATTAGQVVGTIEYMAPEQARGEQVDQRADVYAFGLILYDMLLGRHRHTHAASAVTELQQRMREAPPRPKAIDPALPEALDRIIARCLSPDPAARFRSSAGLAAALEQLDEAGRPLPTDRRLVHIVAGSGLLVIVAMFVITWSLVRPRPPAAAHEPVSVVIADFQNAANDPVFEGTLERALGVAVEEASFITNYSRADAGRIAQKLKPGSRLTDSMARLVALREGVKVVLEGSIASNGGGYSLALRAVNPSDGHRIWAARTTAASKAKVLAALDALAVDLRKSLGDTPHPAADESLTASSLDAVREYSIAQDLASAGRNEEAISHYRAAIAHDPTFGRAYSGWATAAFYLGRKDEASVEWKKALALLGGMTEREQYRTLGTYYLGIARNYEKAIENYSTLVRLYPTDLAGHNNLAFAYFSVLNFAKAREEGDRARRLFPRNILVGNNAALYAMYAGDFAASAAQARALIQQDPSFYKNYLPLAVAALASGDDAAAREAYARMAQTGPVGASLASIGLADVLIYTGRFADAESILKAGIAADEKAGDREAAGVKRVALAEAENATGRTAQALDAVTRALAEAREEATRVPAARLLASVGREAEARAIALRLDTALEPQSRARGRIIEAEIAMKAGRWADALDALRAAVSLSDLWLARYDMGVTYVRAGHDAEGLAELDACRRRRGEATALFLDDTPTFRILAALPYWLGRAQEGVGQQAAAVGNYRTFLSLRPADSRDPLVLDARRRLR